MVYIIIGFLKIDKYSATTSSIIEFSVRCINVMLNFFVEIQIVSFKASTVLCSMNLHKREYIILSNILSMLNRKKIGLS